MDRPGGTQGPPEVSGEEGQKMLPMWRGLTQKVETNSQDTPLKPGSEAEREKLPASCHSLFQADHRLFKTRKFKTTKKRNT